MNNKNRDPWDMGVYRTGSVEPPKRGSGLVPFLLIAVILLAGISTLLGAMNIRLSNKLNQKQEGLMLMEDASEPTFRPAGSSKQPNGDFSLNLQDTPVADNVPQSGGLALQEIFSVNMPSVVSISGAAGQTGSGVIIGAEGYIITNSHLVEGDGLTVTLSDRQVLAATVVGMDPVSDLAVIHVDAKDLTPAVFGNSEGLRIGDAVCAIGPQLGGTMTNGIICAIDTENARIQTNASIHAGGPLVNGFGQVVAIGGQGHAIPSVTVKNVADQLIAQGYVAGSPSLGLSGEAVTALIQNFYGLPAGIYITQVDTGSDAAFKGLTVGDILVSINGTSIATAEDLIKAVAAYKIGDPIEAVIYRDGTPYTVTLTVEEAKD